MMEAGKVFDGEKFIADVQYHYRTTTQHDQGIPVSATVYLLIQPATAVSPFFSGSGKLTLQMSNGKKQDFFVEFPDGRCRGTGGPY
jgi:hypothetical protein